MENIQEQLKHVISDVMLPETQNYLDELNKAIANNEAAQEDKDAKADIESFIAELQTILDVINSNELSDEDAKHVYTKIVTMLEDHSES